MMYQIYTIISLVLFVFVTFCSFYIGYKYWRMVNGGLRIIMILLFASLGWSQGWFLLTTILGLLGVIPRMNVIIMLFSNIAILPVLVTVVVKFFYIKRNTLYIHKHN